MHRRLSVVLLTVSSLVASSPTRADVADDSVDPNCEPVPECSLCRYDQSLAVDDPDAADAEFDACKAAAEEDGLVEACRESSTRIYYCPPGVDIEAGGCSVVPGLQGELALVSAGVLLAAAAMLRARRRPTPKA